MAKKRRAPTILEAAETNAVKAVKKG